MNVDNTLVRRTCDALMDFGIMADVSDDALAFHAPQGSSVTLDMDASPQPATPAGWVATGAVGTADADTSSLDDLWLEALADRMARRTDPLRAGRVMASLSRLASRHRLLICSWSLDVDRRQACVGFASPNGAHAPSIVFDPMSALSFLYGAQRTLGAVRGPGAQPAWLAVTVGEELVRADTDGDASDRTRSLALAVANAVARAAHNAPASKAVPDVDCDGTCITLTFESPVSHASHTFSSTGFPDAHAVGQWLANCADACDRTLDPRDWGDAGAFLRSLDI